MNKISIQCQDNKLSWVSHNLEALPSLTLPSPFTELVQVWKTSCQDVVMLGNLVALLLGKHIHEIEDLTVVNFVDVQGEVLATWGNWSKHPQWLGDELRCLELEERKLHQRKRALYEYNASLPDEEKICQTFMAQMMVDDAQFSIERTERASIPFLVSKILFKGGPLYTSKEGRWVSVRVAGEEETHLGIKIGDLPLGLSARYHRDTEILEIEFGWHNPAIYVPAKNRIVFGNESWWARIKNPEDLRKITDKDIGSFASALLKVAQEEMKGS